MTGHTPGPWRYREIGASVVIETQSPPRAVLYRIAEVAYSIEELEEQNDANARLIAAAPDLLAELQNIATADPSKWEPDVRDQFREWAQSRARLAIAAIAAAEGRPPAPEAGKGER